MIALKTFLTAFIFFALACGVSLADDDPAPLVVFSGLGSLVVMLVSGLFMIWTWA